MMIVGVKASQERGFMGDKEPSFSLKSFFFFCLKSWCFFGLKSMKGKERKKTGNVVGSEWTGNT